jgi:hypothetical protein
VNPSAAWQVLRRGARDVGHDIHEVDDQRGFAAFHCDNCEETFTADITDAFSTEEAFRQVWDQMPKPCRGAPLYRRIPGTPWFDYSPAKTERAR